MCCGSKELEWILHWCWRHFYFTLENVNEVEKISTGSSRIVCVRVRVLPKIKIRFDELQAIVTACTYTTFEFKSSVCNWVVKLLLDCCFKLSNNTHTHSSIDSIKSIQIQQLAQVIDTISKKCCIKISFIRMQIIRKPDIVEACGDW